MTNQEPTNKTDTHLTQIAYQLAQVTLYLARLRQRQAELEASGMWPSVPTERWKDDRYLYLFFQAGESSADLQLDAKGRLYIGADPAKIEEARRRVANRRQWEEVNALAKSLAWSISQTEREIENLAYKAMRWPRLTPEQEGALGLEIARSSGANGPNGLGSDIAGQPGAASPNELGTPGGAGIEASGPK